MTNESTALITALYDEYQKDGLRSRYTGPRKALQKTEGFSWLSRTIGRLVYWPRKGDFTLDDIYIVHKSNLTKI